MTRDWNDNIPETAPPVVPASLRSGVFITLKGHTESLTYEEAEDLHRALGQDLARKMRQRGSSPSPSGPDLGGTPVLMQAAA